MLTLQKPKLPKYKTPGLNLPKRLLKKVTSQTKTFARKNDLAKKPEANLPKP
jgi:hypothetical protein